MMTLHTFMTAFYEDDQGALVPGICTDWSASDDGLIYTLTMDPRAKFSDGTQVTAADLKFSWEYLTLPETQSWATSLVTAPIVGYDDVVNGTATELTGLVALDEATLQITLSEPFTPFIKAITINVAGVVKKENVLSGENWDENPICCGPYKVESWDRDAGVVNWVPNEHWWGTPPTILRVNYRYVADINTQSIMYDNDEVDVIPVDGILAAQMKSGPHAAELIPVPQGGNYFFNFDTSRAPMEDVNVRRALLKASDMGTIVQAIFQGGVRPAYGLTTPNIAGFADPSTYFDPEGAKQALVESSYGSADNLPPISVRVGTNLTEYVRVAEALQQMWKDVLGIEITISLRAPSEEADDGIAQIFRRSVGNAYNDPTVIVTSLGSSKGSNMSFVKATNHEVDAILAEANTLPLTEVDERIRLSQQAEQILMDQAYYIPIVWTEVYFATKPWVIGVKANSSLGLYTLPEMSIAEH
jgi:ABC-type transport system substrate-binding protein